MVQLILCVGHFCRYIMHVHTNFENKCPISLFILNHSNSDLAFNTAILVADSVICQEVTLGLTILLGRPYRGWEIIGTANQRCS